MLVYLILLFILTVKCYLIPSPYDDNGKENMKYSVGDVGEPHMYCPAEEISCASPLDTAETMQFLCDDHCPDGYVCCEDSCFQHKICKPMSNEVVAPSENVKLYPTEDRPCTEMPLDNLWNRPICEDECCPTGHKCWSHSNFRFEVCQMKENNGNSKLTTPRPTISDGPVEKLSCIEFVPDTDWIHLSDADWIQLSCSQEDCLSGLGYTNKCCLHSCFRIKVCKIVSPTTVTTTNPTTKLTSTEATTSTAETTPTTATTPTIETTSTVETTSIKETTETTPTTVTTPTTITSTTEITSTPVTIPAATTPTVTTPTATIPTATTPPAATPTETNPISTLSDDNNGNSPTDVVTRRTETISTTANTPTFSTAPTPFTTESSGSGDDNDDDGDESDYITPQ